MKRYILTGTPGCGKTSILRALEINGAPVIEEAATHIIAYEQCRGIEEPWKSPAFIDHIVRLQRQRQQQTTGLSTPLQYYDRSPFCTYALAVYLGYPPSSLLLEEIDRVLEEKTYEPQVFFLENLGFCTPTDARKISFEEALVFEKIHKEAYDKFGFQRLMIPPVSIEERLQIIYKTTRKHP